jgi:co-chaperonin GroES (HSP10)
VSTTVSGSRGGFIVTRGKPRYAQLEGRHFAVGRGKAYECATVAEAYAKRDEMLKAEQASYAVKRAAALAPVTCSLTVGDLVRIDKGTGTVCEVNARSVLVKTTDGNLWRRAPSACESVP